MSTCVYWLESWIMLPSQHTPIMLICCIPSSQSETPDAFITIEIASVWYAGVQTRFSNCVRAYDGLTVWPGYCDRSTIAVTQPCEVECPRDCELSSPSRWSACEVECGIDAVRSRTFTASTSNKCGRQCPKQNLLTQVRYSKDKLQILKLKSKSQKVDFISVNQRSSDSVSHDRWQLVILSLASHTHGSESHGVSAALVLVRAASAKPLVLFPVGAAMAKKQRTTTACRLVCNLCSNQLLAQNYCSIHCKKLG